MATLGGSITRDTPRPHGVRDPEHARTHLAREPGDPRSSPEVRRMHGRWSAAGSLRTNAADARAWEVRQPRSTEEGLEQSLATSGGGTGGKAAGRAELATGHHAPDTGPGARASGAGASTASSTSKEGSATHGAAAPHLRHRDAQGGVLRVGT